MTCSDIDNICPGDAFAWQTVTVHGGEMSVFPTVFMVFIGPFLLLF